MRRKLILFVVTLLIAGCRCQNGAECQIDDTEGIIDFDGQIIEVDAIKDVGSLDLTFNYALSNLELQLDHNEAGAKYIDVTKDGTSLKIATNEAFKNYENDQKDQPVKPTYTIVRTLTLICLDKSYPLTLTLYVTDTNNNAPTFLQDTYTYIMPMPLVPKIDLTNFGDIQIIAEDIDLTQKELSFTVDPIDKFDVSFKALEKRQYQAVLKVTEYVRYDEDLTLTITASDKDHTAHATITIKKDTEYSQPDIPAFSELVYSFTYSDDEGTPTLTPDDPSKEITITTSNPTETKVSLSNETYFKLEFDKTFSSDIKVRIISTGKPIESTSESVMTLTLTVTLGSESSDSAILIKLPSDVVVTIPKFPEPYYTATYSVDDSGTPSLTLDNEKEIAITQEATNLDIQLEGDDHFSIGKVEDVWTLKVETPLEAETLKKGEDIILSLHATITDDNSEKHEGYGVVIVKLPPVPEIPRFSQTTYTANYTVDPAGEKDTADLTNGPINIVQTDETVDISIVEKTENFKLTKGTDGWTIDVTANLKPTDFNGGKLVFTLTAVLSDADVESGSSTLIITLPEPAKAPSFSASYYTATYNIGDEQDSVTVDGSIQIQDGDDQTVVEVAEPNSDHFEAVANADKTGYDIIVKSKLDYTTLITQADIVLTLQASSTEITEVGEATVVITLPKEVTPAAFSKPYYVGTYDAKSDPDVITIKDTIELSGNYLEQTTVTLTAPTGLENNFELSESSPYTITLKSDIEDINTYNEIVLTLEASLDGTNRKSSATVVLEVPAIPSPPKFSNPLYEFKYEGDSTTGTVTSTDGKTITTDASDPSSVNIVVEDPYSSNFKISYDDTNKAYTFAVDTPLEQDIIDKNTEIFVLLDATVDDSDTISSATVAVKMPEKTEDVIPKFSESYYRADYTATDTDTDTVTISGTVPITITTDKATDTVVKVTGPYEKNFKAEFNAESKSWQITVVTKLDDNTLNTIPEIVVPLEASLTGAADIGTAIIILTLPTHQKDPIPLFDEPLYTAEYSLKEDGTPDVTQVVFKVNSVDSNYVSIKLGDYTDNFAITPNAENTEWTLSSTGTPLSADILKDNVELVIRLTAHMDSSVDDGAAILVIKLPQQNIKFGSPHYSGSYTHNSEDSSKDTVSVADITVEPAGATAIIKDDYAENFEISCDGDGKCTLSVTKPLEESVITSESEIILVLEASKPDISAISHATVVISLPLLENLKAPEFTALVYVGVYSVDESGAPQVALDPNIEIQGVTDISDITVTFDGEHSDSFTITPKDGHWEVTSTELGPEITEKEVSILLNLQATKNGVSVPGLAGLVIQLPKSTDPKTLEFTEAAYVASYEIVNGDDNDKITIDNGPFKITDIADTSTVAIEIEDEAYKPYFELAAEEDHWNVNLLKDLTPELTAEISLLVPVKASIDDRSGRSALIVKLPKKVSPESFYFEDTVYFGQYEEVDNAGLLTLEKEIVVEGDTEGVAVSMDDGEYKNNFKLGYADNKVSLTADQPLSKDVLDKQTITLAITATKGAESTSATVVVKLPKTVVPASFYFEESVYIATYDNGDPPVVNIETAISLVGDIDHSATVELTGDYKDDFTSTYSDDKVTISAKDALSSSVVDKEVTISVGIKATRHSDIIALATLVVQLPKSTKPTFYFEHLVYSAKYDSDPPSLSVAQDISIAGDEDGTAEITLSGEYKDYFKSDYSAGKVTIDLSDSTIPTEVLETNAAITVDITATTPSATATATLIVELPKTGGSTSTFLFDNNVYQAAYTDGDNPSITLDEEISLQGDDDGSATIEVKEYSENFDAIYESNKVSITIKQPLSSDTIDNNVAIAVDIVATKGSDDAITTLVVKLPKKVSPATFSFTSSHYVADYNDDDDEIEVDGITIEGQTDGVTVELEGDYKDNFNVTYADAKVTIALATPLDSDVIDNQAAISLDLVASKGSETVRSTLIVKLPKSGGDDKTGLIAAISVLAVLLVASLVGSAVFYYFKFRRGSSYDEGRPSERFRKNSSTDSKQKVEHPTRRATGVIKYPLEGSPDDGETTTDGEPGMEKRKSVQFDTININELEIVNSSDDDLDNISANSTDNVEERRTSRV